MERVELALDGGDTAVLACSGLGAGFRTDLIGEWGFRVSAEELPSLRQQMERLAFLEFHNKVLSQRCCGKQAPFD